MPEPIHGSVMLTSENVDRIVAVAAKREFRLESLPRQIDRNALRGYETIMFTMVHQGMTPQIANFNAVRFDARIHPSPDVPLMDTDEFIALLETTPETV